VSDPAHFDHGLAMDLGSIRQRIEEDYRSIPWPDTWLRQRDAEALAAQLAATHAALEDLRAEHQCCLNGDEGWAEKWKAKYLATHAAIRALPRYIQSGTVLTRFYEDKEGGWVLWSDVEVLARLLGDPAQE
jgi:hypothetical protein